MIRTNSALTPSISLCNNSSSSCFSVLRVAVERRDGEEGAAEEEEEVEEVVEEEVEEDVEEVAEEVLLLLFKNQNSDAGAM